MTVEAQAWQQIKESLLLYAPHRVAWFTSRNSWWWDIEL